MKYHTLFFLTILMNYHTFFLEGGIRKIDKFWQNWPSSVGVVIGGLRFKVRVPPYEILVHCIFAKSC